jgi:hypothetical protein
MWFCRGARLPRSFDQVADGRQLHARPARPVDFSGDYAKVDKQKGMNVTIVTTAANANQARAC